LKTSLIQPSGCPLDFQKAVLTKPPCPMKNFKKISIVLFLIGAILSMVYFCFLTGLSHGYQALCFLFITIFFGTSGRVSHEAEEKEKRFKYFRSLCYVITFLFFFFMLYHWAGHQVENMPKNPPDKTAFVRGLCFLFYFLLFFSQSFPFLSSIFCTRSSKFSIFIFY
jgi:hypothetical protein